MPQDCQQGSDTRKHCLVLANSLANQVGAQQEIVSGAINSWVRDARQATKPFTILTPDEKRFQLGMAAVTPISEGVHCMDPVLGRRFNGSGGWQIMHSDAYSRFYPRDVLDEMLDAAEVFRRDSLFGAFVEFIERKQPDESIESAFLERFRAPLAALPADSTVSFEGSKIIGLPIRYARDLRVRGTRTIVRWHEAVPEPDQILSFSWGRQMVKSLGCVDTVLLHTDTYRRRLETCFERSGLSHTPETQTYRLGIDFEKFQREVGRLSLSNVHRELANFESLTVRQKNLLLESLATRTSVPNRWVIADTLDPIKGSLQAYEAIGEFFEI